MVDSFAIQARDLPSLHWFRRLARAAACLAAIVVVMGAWVRLTDAGLGCPDWPGCYGHFHPGAGAGAKPWHEMIHRYAAGSLVLAIAALAVIAFRNRRDARQPVAPVLGLLVLVCLQAALGALTVTLLLKPLIVTLHLLGGLSTLALLCWLAQTPPPPPPAARGLRRFVGLAFALLAVQIALGGWTSSNYAAVACPDFPTCRQSFWPAMDFREAFVLWRGIGIDYEGGVLAGPARTAIHFVHRLGAAAVGLSLLALGAAALRSARRDIHAAGAWVLAAVIAQILIGISTVHWGIPLALATLHNAGAAALVIAMTTLLRRVR